MSLKTTPGRGKSATSRRAPATTPETASASQTSTLGDTVTGSALGLRGATRLVARAGLGRLGVLVHRPAGEGRALALARDRTAGTDDDGLTRVVLGRRRSLLGLLLRRDVLGPAGLVTGRALLELEHALVPAAQRHEQRGRDEDRGVRADEDADEQHQ